MAASGGSAVGRPWWHHNGSCWRERGYQIQVPVMNLDLRETRQGLSVPEVLAEFSSGDLQRHIKALIKMDARSTCFLSEDCPGDGGHSTSYLG